MGAFSKVSVILKKESTGISVQIIAICKAQDSLKCTENKTIDLINLKTSVYLNKLHISKPKPIFHDLKTKLCSKVIFVFNSI